MILAILFLALGFYASFGTFFGAFGAGAMFMSQVCSMNSTKTLYFIKKSYYPDSPKDALILVKGLKINNEEAKIKSEWIAYAQQENDHNKK